MVLVTSEKAMQLSNSSKQALVVIIPMKNLKIEGGRPLRIIKPND